MGCISSKQIAAQVALESSRENAAIVSQSRWSNASRKADTIDILTEFRKQEQQEEQETKKEEKKKEKEKQKGKERDKGREDEQEQLLDSNASKEVPVVAVSKQQEEIKEKTQNLPTQDEPNARLSNPVKHSQGEQVAAGWPAWLSAVAGEAIRGWIPRRADSFEKLHKIGQGTYSNVYKARDLETGKLVALKKVRFDTYEPESVRFMAREIQILRRLDHPNVIKLQGLVTSRMSCSLYLVFEYMEHDLAGLAASPGITFSEPQVKCYLQQLLQGLDHCHSHNVLHRDIKGSNLLLDGGNLKIADFGLATICNVEQNPVMTSRVVTLWYRPPELLLGATDYGTSIDLWSTGCILAELLAGRPIMPGRTEVEQLHKIFKLCGSPSEEYWKRSKLPHATIFKPQQPYKRRLADTFKKFPASSVALLEKLLAIEPAERGTAADALKSEFFTTMPLACDPSSLCKYPPSKEFDAKIRAEGTQRQKALLGDLEAGRNREIKGLKSNRIAAVDLNAELQAKFKHKESQLSNDGIERLLPTDEDTSIENPSKSHRVAQKSQGKLTGYGKDQSFSSYAPSRSGPAGMQGWKRRKEEEVRLISSKSVRASKALSTLDGNQEQIYEAEAENGRSYREKERHRQHTSTNVGKIQVSGTLGAKKYRSEVLVKPQRGGPEWPKAGYSKQDTASKSLKKVTDVYNPSDYDKDRSSRNGRTSFQDYYGYSHQSGSVYRSDLRRGLGNEVAVDVEDLLEEHARQTRRTIRQAVRERTHSQATNASSAISHQLDRSSDQTKSRRRAETSQDRR